jgi:hypothetical protein
MGCGVAFVSKLQSVSQRQFHFDSGNCGGLFMHKREGEIHPAKSPIPTVYLSCTGIRQNGARRRISPCKLTFDNPGN